MYIANVCRTPSQYEAHMSDTRKPTDDPWHDTADLRAVGTSVRQQARGIAPPGIAAQTRRVAGAQQRRKRVLAWADTRNGIEQNDSV